MQRWSIQGSRAAVVVQSYNLTGNWYGMGWDGMGWDDGDGKIERK